MEGIAASTILRDNLMKSPEGCGAVRSTRRQTVSANLTTVVAAREDGFNEVFLGEHRWHHIRIHSSMLPKIRYVAAYQVAPVSAITYVGEVAGIEPWKDTGKYVLNFKEPAKALPEPVPLVSRGRVLAPQAPRYTSFARLLKAKTLDDVF